MYTNIHTIVLACKGPLGTLWDSRVAKLLDFYGLLGLLGMPWNIRMAETERFELSIHITMYNDLANRRLQPLGHVSLNLSLSC